LIIVVMGVSGTGKTTLGQALAARLGWTFVEADDYHPPSNIEKMRGGRALDEKDRDPWLDAVNARIRAIGTRGEHAVLACSALRRVHREKLADGIQDVRFVYLAGDPELIDTRLRERRSHFMPARLLGTQLMTLEPPADALTVSLALPTRRQVDAVIQGLEPPQSS
jgi:gluconokinase